VQARAGTMTARDVETRKAKFQFLHQLKLCWNSSPCQPHHTLQTCHCPRQMITFHKKVIIP